MVCVDHFILDGLRFFYAMDAWTHYSAGLECDDASMATPITAFDAAWLSYFWPPAAVLGDQALKMEGFKNFVRDHAIEFRPTLPRRPSKNLI